MCTCVYTHVYIEVIRRLGEQQDVVCGEGRGQDEREEHKGINVVKALSSGNPYTEYSEYMPIENRTKGAGRW